MHALKGTGVDGHHVRRGRCRHLFLLYVEHGRVFAAVGRGRPGDRDQIEGTAGAADKCEGLPVIRKPSTPAVDGLGGGKKSDLVRGDLSRRESGNACHISDSMRQAADLVEHRAANDRWRTDQIGVGLIGREIRGRGGRDAMGKKTNKTESPKCAAQAVAGSPQTRSSSEIRVTLRTPGSTARRRVAVATAVLMGSADPMKAVVKPKAWIAVATTGVKGPTNRTWAGTSTPAGIKHWISSATHPRLPRD